MKTVFALIVLALATPAFSAESDTEGAPNAAGEKLINYMRDLTRAKAIGEKCSSDKLDYVDIVDALFGANSAILSKIDTGEDIKFAQRISAEADVARHDVENNYSCKGNWEGEIARIRHARLDKPQDIDIRHTRK